MKRNNVLNRNTGLRKKETIYLTVNNDFGNKEKIDTIGNTVLWTELHRWTHYVLIPKKEVIDSLNTDSEKEIVAQIVHNY